MIDQQVGQIKVDFCTMGIDPALRKTGIGILRQGKTRGYLIRPGKSLRGAARLVYIRDKLVEILKKERPTAVAMEGYSYDSVGRWFDLGEAGGIIKVALYENGITPFLVPPNLLKLFITGHGDATKDDVLRAVRERYRILISDDNIADAIALAKFANVFLNKRNTKYRSELEAVKKLALSMSEKEPKHLLKISRDSL